MLEITVTEGIIIALITVIGAIVTALLNKKLTMLEKHQEKSERFQKETHHQVHNNGGSSLKDGVDEALGLLRDFGGRMDVFEVKLDGVKDGMLQNRENIEFVRNHQSELDQRLDRERRDREAGDHPGRRATD